MSILLVLLESVSLTLATWAVTLQLALYAALPVRALQTGFVLLLIVLAALLARPIMRRVRTTSKEELAFSLKTLAIGSLLGFVLLVSYRPDSDDVTFLHQLIVDCRTPSEPLTLDPFVVPHQGGNFSIQLLNENEAYEAMVVVLAQLLGLDPLNAYHNIFAFLATIAWAATYALLFRRFRIPRRWVWLAVLLTTVFLLLDGNLHRSFGNVTLLRIWQGKIVAWAILLPMFMLFALRFLSRPSLYRFGLLVATAGASTFVNRSAGVMTTVSGAGIALAYFINYGATRRRLKRCLLLGAATLPLWAALAYVSTSMLRSIDSPSPPSSISREAYGSVAVRPTAPSLDSSWWSQLYHQVVGSPTTLARDALFLLVLPLIALRRPQNRFLPTMTLVVTILALSPLTGPAWHNLLSRAYWRLYYVLPLPLCAGLTVGLLLRNNGSQSRRPTRFTLGTALFIMTIWAVERPALSKSNNVRLKPPFEYRLSEEALGFVRDAARVLEGKTVLAGDAVSGALALTQSDSVEPAFERVFGSGQDGRRAHRALQECKVNAWTAASVEKFLDRGVDAIVTQCDERSMVRLQRRLPAHRLVRETGLPPSATRLYWVLLGSHREGSDDYIYRGILGPWEPLFFDDFETGGSRAWSTTRPEGSLPNADPQTSAPQ